MDIFGQKKHVIDTVFVILLLFLFILSALAVITIGANIYQKNVDAMEKNYSSRIACAYITEKIRQSDVGGQICVRDEHGLKCLVLQQKLEGELYNTYIYAFDGYLMELFAKDDLAAFYPQAGQKILPVSSFDMNEINAYIISAHLTMNDGSEETFLVTKRSTSGK